MFSSFFSLVSNVVEVGKMEKDRAFFVEVLRVCTFSSFFFIFSMSNHLLKMHSHLVGRCERRTLSMCCAFFLTLQGIFRVPHVEARFKARLKNTF